MKTEALRANIAGGLESQLLKLRVKHLQVAATFALEALGFFFKVFSKSTFLQIIKLTV